MPPRAQGAQLTCRGRRVIGRPRRGRGVSPTLRGFGVLCSRANSPLVTRALNLAISSAVTYWRPQMFTVCSLPSRRQRHAVIVVMPICWINRARLMGGRRRSASRRLVPVVSCSFMQEVLAEKNDRGNWVQFLPCNALQAKTAHNHLRHNGLHRKSGTIKYLRLPFGQKY